MIFWYAPCARASGLFAGKATIRMAYGFHHANSLIALVMLRCAGNHGASDNRDTPLLTYRRSMVL